MRYHDLHKQGSPRNVELSRANAPTDSSIAAAESIPDSSPAESAGAAPAGPTAPPGPETAEPQAGVPPLGERLTEEKGAQLYRRLQEALTRLLREAAADQQLRLDSLLPLIDQMVTRDDLLNGPLSKIALGHGSPDNALSDHLLHVAILSVKMGKESWGGKPRGSTGLRWRPCCTTSECA